MHKAVGYDGCVPGGECFHDDTEATAGMVRLHACGNRCIAFFIKICFVPFAGKGRGELKDASDGDNVEQAVLGGDVRYMGINNCSCCQLGVADNIGKRTYHQIGRE